MPLPKGCLDFDCHQADVMNFLLASSELEDVGGEISANETEDNNKDLVNQAADNDSSSQLVYGDTDHDSDTAE